jgi:tRNA dimethylallyltransferase
MIKTKNPLIVIIGPTAVGKTEISLQVAEVFKGEILSADSRLFYRGMDIGTAKPSLDERNRVPHHFIDITDPDQDWTLALYLPQVYQTIESIHQRGKLPFLVGGTGQYIQAVVQGWKLPVVKPDPKMRDVLTQWADQVGVEGMRHRLETLDPEAAGMIDGPNLRRMVRALEVILSSGHKFSEQRDKSGTHLKILQIGLTRPREELYQRIDNRIERMLEEGLIREVEDLLEKGYSPDLSSMSAIGYKQIIDHLQGECSLEEAVQRIRSKTRKYVRQQANWFREDDSRIHWFNCTEDPTAEIIDHIQRFLS